MRRLMVAVFLLVIPFLPSAWSAPTVLFEQGHGQAFTIENDGELQLSRLAGIFRNDGWQVQASSGAVTRQRLLAVDALVISGAFRPFTPAEIETIVDFVHRGGRLVVMLHVAPPLVNLLHRFGVVTATGVVHEGDKNLVLGGQATNFRVKNLQSHPLTRGIAHFALYGGWPLLAQGGNVHSLAATGPTAWVDLNRDKQLSQGDAVQEFSVLLAGKAGQGAIAVFADDAVFQNRFLVGENTRLAKNLSRWLQGVRLTGVEI